MGVNFTDLIDSEEIDIDALKSRTIAIDALNSIYQFISVIRRYNGEPLKDSKGRITSHLSGLFYRTTKLVEKEIKVCYVFDGETPNLKDKTSRKRRQRRKKAREKYEKALKKGDTKKAKKYAQQSVSVQEEMIEQSKRILRAMGIPCIQAPSEGEAQAAHMAQKEDIWAVGSQDYDSLLFGAPILIKNLSITGKRKLPGKKEYKHIKPELIDLKKNLEKIKITREKLIWMAILIGTDYNSSGIKGIGPKKALTIVKKHDDLDSILEEIEWESDNDPEKILNFFKNPPVTDSYKLEWKEPDVKKIKEILCKQHDFSEKRIAKSIDILKNKNKSRQSRLDSF